MSAKLPKCPLCGAEPRDHPHMEQGVWTCCSKPKCPLAFGLWKEAMWRKLCRALAGKVGSRAGCPNCENLREHLRLAAKEFKAKLAGKGKAAVKYVAVHERDIVCATDKTMRGIKWSVRHCEDGGGPRHKVFKVTTTTRTSEVRLAEEARL